MVSKLDVKSFTNSKLMQIIHGNPEKRSATLAYLRDGVGRQPGDVPMIWQPLFSDMPDEMMGSGRKPSYAVWAVYIALTMFALHQQGKDIDKNCMHKEGDGSKVGDSLGTAMAKMVESKDDENRIMKRFNSIATAEDIGWLSMQLQRGVRLLSNNGIPLDYVRLAGDLFEFQFEEGQERTRLSWGQDFYRQLNKQYHNKAEKAKGETK